MRGGGFLRLKKLKEEFQMRNLKRVLSLALASVMVVSMMVIGAGAANFDDFSDKDKIVNTEAVSVLNSLNIINGKDDGSYDPTGIVTRAEMSKMICVALNGGNDPQLGNVTNYTYTDTVGHWAAPYIEYCSNLGIVAGDGTGKFNPNATVTGSEASKMLLVAIGYSADIEGLVGPSWAINVNVLANTKDFFVGLSALNPSEGLSRDDAAQLIYNAIQAGMVKYEYNWVTDGATVTSKPQRVDDTEPLAGGTAKIRTILNYRYGVDTYQGVVMANEYASISGGIQEAGQIRYNVTMINDNAASGTMTVAVDTSLDMLGKNVTLLIKDSKVNNVYTQVYGSAFVNDSNNIYTTTARKTNQNSFDKDVKAAGITSIDNNATTGTQLYVNYTHVSTGNTFANAMAQTGNGYTVSVIDNDNDNKADLIMVVKPDIGVVSSYNEKGNGGDGAITVASKGILNPVVADRISNAEFADVVGAEDVAKDDVVSYLKLENDKFYVTKLESIEGKVQSVTGTQKMKVDGTTYTGSDLARVINEDNVTVNYHRGGTNSVGLKDSVTVGDTAKVYLDAAGYVVYIAAVEAPDNFVLLTNVEITGAVSGVKAKAVFADGSESTITVNALTHGTTKYTGAGADSDDLVVAAGNAFNAALSGKIATDGVARIYTYSKRDDGSYDLKTLSAASYTADSATSGQKITKGHATLPGVTGAANDGTIYVVKDGSSWSVYTGVKNVPTLTLNADAPVAVDNGSVAVVFVTDSSVVGDRKSVYVLDNKVTASQDEKGNDVYTIKALVDGEYTELEVDGANKNTTVARGLYYDESAANNIAVVNNSIDLSDLTGAAGNNAYADPMAITGMKKGNVTVLTGNGSAAPAQQTLVTNDNTKVILIDGVDAEDISVGSLSDLVYDSTNPGSCSVAVAVRGSADPTDADYGFAAYIYVIL